MSDGRRPDEAVIRDAQSRLAMYDQHGYTAQHGSSSVPSSPPTADELRVRSWQQDGCRFDLVAARGVALIYVEGRFAEEVLHPTQACLEAIDQRDSFRASRTRYSGWH